MSSRNVYDFSYEKKHAAWLRVVYQHALQFILLEVNIPRRCSLKAKAIQSCVRKQNNCRSFDHKTTSSRILRRGIFTRGVKWDI